MVEYLKIPAGRIKFLLENKAKVLKQIESATKTKVEIDKELNEVVISETPESDMFLVLKAKDFVKAIGRGFEPEVASRLLEEDADLQVMELGEYLGKNKKTIIRIKGRIIGEQGKAKKKIEDLTNTNIVVYGKTIAIIGTAAGITAAIRAVERLIGGAMHGTTFKLLKSELKTKAEEL